MCRRRRRRRLRLRLRPKCKKMDDGILITVKDDLTVSNLLFVLSKSLYIACYTAKYVISSPE